MSGRAGSPEESAMTKAATITEIEHKIEALPPTDQLKLLERIVRHLKHSLTAQPPVTQRKTDVAGIASTGFCGAWQDDRSAEEIIADIEAHRTGLTGCNPRYSSG